MKSLALQRAPKLARPARGSSPSQPTVLAQRRSTLGPQGSIAAPPITDSGRPLDATARNAMETGFGRDFSGIRVHDDARAHDSARSLGARAYAAGDHIVFGEGTYQPQTATGRALIAHELAHSVQQSGVQMKADGPLPAASDAELEAQADRAALDVTSGRRASGLSTIGRPAIYRTTSDPPAGGVATTPAAGPPQNLPAGMTAIKDEPAGVGTTELVVAVQGFALPAEKGVGPWVKSAHEEAASGRRLVFSPLIEGSAAAAYDRIAAFKEGGEAYKEIWLGKFGFTTTKSLSTAFRSAAETKEEVKAALANKGVAHLIKGMDTNLKSSGCDIDHIVEKQMGGTSIPSNLQLLTSEKNQKSGRDTYQALVGLVEGIRSPTMRGRNVRKLQLQLQAVTVPTGTSDPSFIVEDLLRKGLVKGSEEVKAKSEGKPVALSAGGVGETVRVRDTGPTLIDAMAKRVVPGMRLVRYVRASAKSKADTVEGELDSRAVSKTSAESSVVLSAELAPAATTIGAGAGGSAAEENEAASESRLLKLDKSKNKKIAFYYPYLSPGLLTSVSLDDKGNLSGEGVIKPSVPFLGDLNIRYSPDTLEMVAPLRADKLKPPIPNMRFTEGKLELTLSPSFIPKGNLKFEIGPKGRPIILGDLRANLEGGAFVATGTLEPGGKVPGISAAEGKVEYNSDKGWSGKLVATNSSIPNSTIDAELGFSSEKGNFRAYGAGGVKTKIKDSELSLRIAWAGGAVNYRGGVTIEKPLPLVERVRLEGAYAEELLTLTGEAGITWKSIASKMLVTYRRKDGEEGKFSGKAGVDIKTEKALGHLDLNFDEAGKYWGKGEVSYQVTKDIRPKLGVEVTPKQRVKVLGEVALADIPLSKMWPSPEGGNISIIKGVGAKFDIQTPVPGITAFGEIRGSLGLGYGVGPVILKGVKFNGELYPLEDDPQIKARLIGNLSVPAYGEVHGTFGAYIGLEVLLGAAGAKGGVDVTPTLRVTGEGGVDFDAGYEAGAFTFSAEAYAKGKMEAQLRVDLKAKIYAVWGVFSHEWTYNVASLSKQIGPELKLKLGKIAYGKDGEITWPKLSDIKPDPENLDPKEIVKDLMRSGKAEEKGAAAPVRDNIGNKI